MITGSIEEKLKKYTSEDNYPFHMPGHKRNEHFQILAGVNKLDLTEIDGFDNYHNPTDLLLEEFGRATKVYKSDKSFYLVNGCSGGILAAVSAVFSRGEKILVGRNCHKAVYNAMYLQELEPIYIYPDLIEGHNIFGAIRAEQVQEILEKEADIKGIVITSPTYEGVVSDIESIAKVAHEKNVVLIVDEAHGAHFGFDENFPESGLKLGADIVIQGLHKTMPSLTQTAIMHVKSNLVDVEKLQMYVSMYQTTSPSYLFMASISTCINTVSLKAKELFSEYAKHLDRLRERLGAMKHLKLLKPAPSQAFDYDKSKVVIYTGNTNLTGKELQDILINRYYIQPEMASLDYIILMTTFCDKWEHYDVLATALKEIDEGLVSKADICKATYIEKCDKIYTSFEAVNMKRRTVKFKDSANFISGEYVYVYPPGIPVLVPGERISENVIEKIQEYKDNRLEVIGLRNDDEDIVVLDKEI